ncbi:MAG: hypothetical protein FWF94_06160 [Oscillospiraceae bacterium]|nr:hypothetical protein [Oscillospiraceae bacterium]
MNIEKRITLDMLTSESVSILTQRFIEGEQLGKDHRQAFSNSVHGRAGIAAALDESHLTAVMAIWGESPTIEERVQLKTSELNGGDI